MTDLLLGTLLLRPYVFAFLAAFLGMGLRDLGRRGTLAFAGWTFLVAWIAEHASTRVGVPFGLYHYTGLTRERELFLANVPFFDSLSFVFLAYTAWCVARLLTRKTDGPTVVAVSGVAMMLLDVVIDPLAVRGERWFLGHLFDYPEPGLYFGVPLSNFVGWMIVGWVSIGGFLALGGRARASPISGVALYYGVLAFNLWMTWWIGEPLLLAAGVAVHAVAVAAVLACRRVGDAARGERIRA